MCENTQATKLKGGLSGCELFLSDGVVTKKSSQTYESRLSSQRKKQEVFGNFVFKNIEIPKVLDSGTGWFSMDYARGVHFTSFLEKASKRDLDFIIDTLSEYFNFLENTARPSNESVRDKILKKIDLMMDTELSIPTLTVLSKAQQKLDIFALPKSMCHGDLTFSNILFNRNKLWFIDFLDTFVDSYILDFVKLKQDLYYNWSMKTQKSYSLRLSQAKRYIWGGLCERKKHIVDNQWFDFFDTLNILRIQPYIKSDEHKKVFNEVIKRTPYYENIDRSYGG